jgi:maltokinase
MVPVGRSAAVASRLLGRDLRGERPMDVDQTNESIVVAEEVVVKWMRPPVPSPHPGAEVLMYLRTSGFRAMPAFIGVEEHGEMVEAIVTEYVPDSLDGWDWFVDDVDRWLQGRTDLDSLLATAWRLGAMTGDLHTALTGLQRSTIGARTYHAFALDRLDEALRVVAGDEGARLRALEPAVREMLEPLRGDRVLPAHRVHGDLHVGQFLRAADRIVINDFDGNPLVDPTQRRLPHSPLRDLASLLQSIDHVGRIVVKRRHPDRAEHVEVFNRLAVEAALHAYEDHHTVERDILRALRVAQELHEYLYAVAHLPRWLYVPDAALPVLLAG